MSLARPPAFLPPRPNSRFRRPCRVRAACIAQRRDSTHNDIVAYPTDADGNPVDEPAIAQAIGKEEGPMQIRRQSPVPQGTVLPMLLMFSSFALFLFAALVP